jgi:hypothetical protein
MNALLQTNPDRPAFFPDTLVTRRAASGSFKLMMKNLGMVSTLKDGVIVIALLCLRSFSGFLSKIQSFKMQIGQN